MGPARRRRQLRRRHLARVPTACDEPDRARRHAQLAVRSTRARCSTSTRTTRRASPTSCASICSCAPRPARSRACRMVVCWSADHAAGERALEPLRKIARTAQGTRRTHAVRSPAVDVRRGLPRRPQVLPEVRARQRAHAEGHRYAHGSVPDAARRTPLTMQLQGMGGAAASREARRHGVLSSRSAVGHGRSSRTGTIPRETDANIAAHARRVDATRAAHAAAST